MPSSRKNSPGRLTLAFVALPALGLALLSSGCDERTAEEKGHDYAQEKIGFVEGAAKVLEEKGKDLGGSVSKGVGDLVKGAGSAAKDALHPSLAVDVDAALTEAGVKLSAAHEGESRPDAREVTLSLVFEKTFHGRILLTASDEEGSEVARAISPQSLEQATGSQATLELGFPPKTRLSKVARYQMTSLPAKTVTPEGKLAPAAFTLTQLREAGTRVSLYVVFVKPYRGGLQLRAQDADGKELGRSAASEPLNQAADSAKHLDFDFDAPATLSNAARYTLHQVRARSEDLGNPR